MLKYTRWAFRRREAVGQVEKSCVLFTSQGEKPFECVVCKKQFRWVDCRLSIIVKRARRLGVSQMRAKLWLEGARKLFYSCSTSSHLTVSKRRAWAAATWARKIIIQKHPQALLWSLHLQQKGSDIYTEISFPGARTVLVLKQPAPCQKNKIRWRPEGFRTNVKALPDASPQEFFVKSVASLGKFKAKQNFVFPLKFWFFCNNFDYSAEKEESFITVAYFQMKI